MINEKEINSLDLPKMIADFSSSSELTPKLREQRRSRICEFETALVSLDESIGDTKINEQIVNHFGTGVYGREMFIPAGQLIVSKIHKGKTMNFIMKGTISVISEEGVNTYHAPYVFVSSEFTKRIVLAHSDVIWATAQGSYETDLDKIEEELIARDFTEIDNLLEKGE